MVEAVAEGAEVEAAVAGLETMDRSQVRHSHVCSLMKPTAKPNMEVHVVQLAASVIQTGFDRLGQPIPTQGLATVDVSRLAAKADAGAQQLR